MSDEEVLVIPAISVRFEGFARDSDVLETIDRSGLFLRRDLAEEEPLARQVIPYIVVTDGNRVFGVRRLAGSGEARLRDRIALGVGGHINPIDSLDEHDEVTKPGLDAFRAGMLREWNEEVIADFEPEFAPVGYVANNDDVGRVHVGVVFRVDAAGRPIAIRETDKLEGRFYTIDELRSGTVDLEGWGGIVAQALFFGE